jgi:hypothetical protein
MRFGRDVTTLRRVATPPMAVADVPRIAVPQPSLTERLVDIRRSRLTNDATADFLVADYLQAPMIRLSVSPEVASSRWFRPALDQFETAMGLPADWDSYGGTPTALASVQKAVYFLLTNMRAESSPPTVVPMSDGGVQLVWHNNGVDVEVTFGMSPDSDELYVHDAATDSGFDGPAAAAEAPQVLNEAFRRLHA